MAVRYRSRLDWRARHASLGLSTDVPWTIEISGGLSGLSGDLRGLRLRSLDLRGGVDELELDLPVPDGTSRIHVSGGPANVTLLHPSGRGGAGDRQGRRPRAALRLRGRCATSTASCGWRRPGAGAAPDRYEVEISGGVRFLRITPA